jgi:acyl transferase domain-containing protein
MQALDPQVRLQLESVYEALENGMSQGSLNEATILTANQ